MTYIKYFPVVMLLLALGCSKDFIEKEPLVGTQETVFYQTEEDAIFAVNSAYAALQFEMSGAGHFRWFWGDIMSDDSTKGGSGPNDVNDLLLLETFAGPTNTDLLESEWRADYTGIYRSNVVLQKVPDIEMDETLKARILGEAKFIRAYFYYQLVTIFGDVPLVLEPLAPSEYQIGRTPKAEVWAAIEQDLREASEVLPFRSGYSAANTGRVTKGAAQAMLLKALLYQQKFGEAQPLAEEIRDSGEYNLSERYEDIFTQEGENGPGSVFEIQYMNASGGNWGYNQQNEGTFTNVFQRARGQFEGFGFNIPTQEFVQEFEPGDPRLRATVFSEGDAMGDRGIFTKEATGGFPHDYYPKKYFNNASEAAPFGDQAPNGLSNDRVIRYADVLLMLAEAAYHNGDEDTARAAVNAVRARARMSATQPVLLPIASTGPNLLQSIYHERRVELGLEGHRFFDLVRQNRAAEVLADEGFTAGVHEVFPVPDSQIQATNGEIVQNPGY